VEAGSSLRFGAEWLGGGGLSFSCHHTYTRL